MNATLSLQLAAALLCWTFVTVTTSVLLSMFFCIRAIARSRAEMRTHRFRDLAGALQAQAGGAAAEEAERREKRRKLRLFWLWQQQREQPPEIAEDPWRAKPLHNWPNESHGDLPDAGERHTE